MDVIAEEIQRLLEGDRRERDAAAFRLKSASFDPHLLVPVLEHPHASRQPFLVSPIPIVAEKTIKTLGKIGSAAPDLIVAALEHANDRLNILDVLSYPPASKGWTRMRPST